VGQVIFFREKNAGKIFLAGPGWIINQGLYRAFHELSIILRPDQGLFFTIFIEPGRDGPEDKIDGPDRAENIRQLQVYTR